jgi:hypothetical protein
MDHRCRNAERFLLASGHGMIVRESHDFEPCAVSFLKEQPGAGLAQAAVYAMFFHSDHPISFGSGFAHRRLVQRLKFDS